jgi:nicotinate-nucleotide pyrophosphorylase (carboxylating)
VSGTMTGDSTDTLTTLVRLALVEDVGDGDWTTQWTVPPTSKAVAHVVAKENLVVAGTEAFRAVYETLDSSVGVDVRMADGSGAVPGDVAIVVEGTARSVLTGERTALNFLGRLSGIATLTHRFVVAVEGTAARITDTRKTTPGWRALEKAAVRAGGGVNHRFGLHDMVLIKENHVEAAGGLAPAVERVREANTAGLAVEVEVRSLTELDEVLERGVQRVLLDNMSPAELAAAVTRARQGGRPVVVEASGNVDLTTVRAIAETGVDVISVGALTHSAPTADFTLLLQR